MSLLVRHLLQRGSRGSSSLLRGMATATHTLKVGENRSLAFREIPGQELPTVVYVPGLHSYSNMSGMMSNCLLRYCDVNHHNCVTYDHECMGFSEGDRRDVLFSHWVQDVNTVVEELTEGPVVLVSLSMGGWLALAAAQHYPALAERLVGMVLYAPALNYAYPYYQYHRDQLSEETRSRLDQGDIHVLEHTFGDAMLKRDFAEDSLKYEIDLKREVNIDCPVRIIHGLQDKEVPPQQSLDLVNALRTPDVDLIYRKAGLHQAEEPPDIELIINTLDRLIKHV